MDFLKSLRVTDKGVRGFKCYMKNINYFFLVLDFRFRVLVLYIVVWKV